MQRQAGSRWIGGNIGKWVLREFAALCSKAKAGRKTKKILRPPGLPLMFAKFKNWPVNTDKPAAVTCLPPSPATLPVTATLEPMAPLPGGKLGEIAKRLSGKDGASLDDLMTLTGWRRPTVRAALSRLRQKGFCIEAVPEKGDTIYRLKKDRVQP